MIEHDLNGAALYKCPPIPDFDENNVIESHRIGAKWRCGLTWEIAVRAFCGRNIMATELDALEHTIPQQKIIVEVLLEVVGEKLHEDSWHLSDAEYLDWQTPIDDYWQEKQYYGFLIERQAELLAGPTQAADATTAPRASRPAAHLSLRQVALLHIYQSLVIPKAADEIARKYGHTSGAKLYEHYRKLSHRTGRTGVEGQQLLPMLGDIAAVIPHLDGVARQNAENELQTLNAKK
jgi:hypothetical protein